MINSVNRVLGKSIRAKGTRVLGLAGMLSMLACGSESAPTANPTVEGYRSNLATHKVQLNAEQARELEKRGAKMQLIGDYGSFKLVEVDEKTLASLPEGAEPRDDLNDILLNAGTIDTASEHGKSLKGMKLQASGKRFHMVQYGGPIQPEWFKALEATGVKVVSYIPNNAYLVYGDAATLSALQGHITATAAIQWHGEYLNDFKLNPSIHTANSETFEVQLLKDEESNEETLALIQRLQSRSGTIQEAYGYVNVHTYLTVKDLYEIAARPDVLSLQPRPMPRKFDERQNMIISGQLTGTQPNPPNWLAWLAEKGFTQAQFTASGFGVDVTDSGVDNAVPAAPNHFGLYVGGNISNASRLAYSRLEGTPHGGSTIQGCDGHGNINAHIIGGYTNQTGAPFEDAQGYNYGLGVAPFVKVGSSVIFDPGTFTSPDYEDLQSRAYRDGMRVSSNSWGANTSAYTSDAQRYDFLARDAQPASSAVPNAGHQEMVIVFAAGNSGPGAGSVGSPGTAKNIITAGASKNAHVFGGADQCAVPDSDANDAMGIVGFSSRGPAADGRKKPELMAPGTHVSGGVAQVDGQRANPPANPNGQALGCFDASGVCAGPGSSNFWPLNQQWYTASSGTSHSTPAIAGGAALIRQYFINQNMTPPSAAMTKAYLMNSARYMTGSGANDNLWSNNQGMGLMDLGMALDGTPRLLDDQNPSNVFTATGQTREFEGFVADSTKPFRVTVAWTDAPGSTTGSAWKNNLDLTVTIGGNTYKGNVFTGANSTTGGTADGSNNVESVFLPVGAEGNFTVTVTAANINSDGIPDNAAALDQDFALIAYNTCQDAPPTPDGVSAAPNGDNEINITWTENGATSYSIYRATTAGGPYTKVGSATAPPYRDIGVSGGTTYYYVVRGKLCAESPRSTEASATATGVCTLAPTFSGVDAATNAGAATCGTTVAWNAATPICGGTLSYSVYRSTTAGFTPSIGNRIATGITGTSFADDLNLTTGTRYYYVVRATEQSTASNEDSNTVEKSAVPTGAVTPGVRYFDDLDGNRPPDAASYWIPTAQAGSVATISVSTGCHYQSADKAYRFGGTTASCTATYPSSVQATLSLGGNGTTPGINGFAIPASTLGPQMSFNIWYSMETRYDGAWLVYSTTGAAGPWTNVGDTASATAPYIATGGYDNTLQSTPTTRIWTTANTGGNGALKAVTVNLEALAGQTVWFAYKFFTDGSVVDQGFYVDDVRVNADGYESCTTNVPPPGPAVSYQVTNLPASSGAGDTVTFDVTALDAVGQTAVGYTGTASFSSSDPQAVLPADATFAAGVATGVSMSFRTLGDQSVTASDTADAAINGSATTNVTAGAPTALEFRTQPSDSTAGEAIFPSVQVGLVDQFGNDVTTGENTITVALGANPGNSTLSGSTTVDAANGVATFGNLSLDKVAAGYTLVASADGLTGLTSAEFAVGPGAPAKLAIVTQPSNTQAGASITPAVSVIILDEFDNTTDAAAEVSVSLNDGGMAQLSGTTTVEAVNGVASFGDLWIDKVGTGYSLEVTSDFLDNVTTDTFDITPAAPHRVIITRQPSDVAKGRAITPSVQATVLDRFNNVATQTTAQVSAALGSNPKNATLRGATSVNPVSGVATFSDLSVSKEGLNYTLIIGSSGLHADTSVGFDVTGRQASDKLAFRPVSDTASADSALAAIEVELQDDEGNNTGGSEIVTLSLGENPAGGQLLGTSTVAAVNGVAKFEGLTLRKAGSAYALVAKAEGYADATSAAFAVNPGAAASFVVAVPASVTAGQETTISATAYDAHGNVAASYAGAVNVTSSDSGATFASTATFVEGKLNNFKVTFKTNGSKTLTLTDAGNTTLASTGQTNVTAFAQPTAAVTSPEGGNTVSGSVSITATGAAASGTTLAKLQILVDGKEIASGSEGTLSGTWNSDDAQGGTHIITAVATDAAGNVVTSAPVIVSTEIDSGCGCGATSGTDAGFFLLLLVLARFAMGRSRAKMAA
ncbi:S8 family serine peptidase [Hyalangium sp.]|uniref:S8 family serine peptidase n=1 Tax=Hyalangium sp. TaxID=2028555 RepID=UPI002D360355|nr:S8 family serine peptidase [Hyalangium sp.]HYH99699.1 S8 family serine peptidase [Hyalangium sp.]